MSTNLVIVLPIGDNVFEDPDQLLRLREAIRFLPKSFRLVADYKDTRVIVFGLDVLAQLVERPVDVLLFTGQEEPTRMSVKAAAIFLQTCRRISFRIYRNRNEKHILPQSIAERVLHLLEVAIHRRT